jgi:uncharacterized repeat protein (TIGR01451 family)
MKSLRLVSLIVLFAALLPALLLPGLALAQDGSTDNATPPAEEPPPPPETITLSTEYPTLEAIATGSFDFNVKMVYDGTTDRVFDLDATAPSGWSATITPQYDTQLISSITMEKTSYTPTTNTVKVSVSTPSWPLADPGEYTITLKASSGDLSASIDLTAKITAKYSLDATPSNQLYSTTAKAGRDNTYSITVTNIGTAPIDNISFSASKPTGWEITYQPEKIDTLEILDPKTIDVNIKPAPDTVAGDYMITLTVSGKQAYAHSLDVRVTVVASSIWGWVGVAIIVVVVIGLVVIFMRFGRR